MSTWTFLEKPGSCTGLSEEPSTGVPGVQLEPCMERKTKLFCQMENQGMSGKMSPGTFFPGLTSILS